MKSLLILVFLGVLSMGAQAQTAEEIVNQYLENIGGVKAWKQLNTAKMIGKITQQGMEMPFTMYSKTPNKEYIELEVMGKKIVEGFNGVFLWRINPFIGETEAKKATEEESAERAKSNSSVDNKFLNWKQKGSTIKLEGRKEINGVNCLIVKFTSSEGDESRTYFDAENKLPVMESRILQGEGASHGKESRIYYSDYDEVEGLYFAHQVVTKIDEQTMLSMTIEKIEINIDLEDAQFEIPK